MAFVQTIIYTAPFDNKSIFSIIILCIVHFAVQVF